MILDTNALFAAADNDPEVVRLISSIRRIAVRVMAIGEYRRGIARSRSAGRYRQWLEVFRNASPTLDITSQTSHDDTGTHLELKQIGKAIPVNDLSIGGTLPATPSSASESRPAFRFSTRLEARCVVRP